MNAGMLLGKAEPRSVSKFNLFVGVLLMVPFYIIATMDDPAVIPKLDEMIGEGLVTTEEVQIVISRPVPRP
ncbi:MAG: hypothetical protein M3P92_04620 [Actinomycetota bacterium]|nr:hypothetical protein [Actinomycetota bacterium]